MIHNTNHPTIVGIGELLWDMLPGNPRLGGAPTNFALHSNALGGKAAIVSAVGSDKLGQDILNQLQAKQIETRYIETNTLPTSQVDVLVCDKGHPTYTIHENVAWDNLSLPPKSIELAKSCNAVCFGTLAQRKPISRTAIQKFLANTNKDCLKIFDINLRQNHYTPDTIYESLQTANILKLNDDELILLQKLFNLPTDTNSALESILNHYKLKLIALTKGAEGSIMMDKNSISYCPGLEVNVKDTVGAGDSFTAAMTIGLLSKMPLNTINRAATQIAAYVCSQPGATPTLPETLISELKYNMPTIIEETNTKTANSKKHFKN